MLENSYKTPWILTSLWTALVVTLFFVTAHTELSLLFKSSAQNIPSEVDQPHIPPENNYLSQLSIQPIPATPTPPPAQPAPQPSHKPTPPPHPAAPKVHQPVFASTPTAISAKISFDQRPKHDYSIFQHSPAAWVVVMQGQWQRNFKEEFTFPNGLIGRVRFIKTENSLRIAFYYTDKAAPQSRQPQVAVNGKTLSITIDGDR